MEIINVEQRSEEWFKLREKRMTASHAQAIGANGKGLISYTMELMQEFYSKAEKEYFSNKDTDRGNDLEDSASFVYSVVTGLEVRKIGFVIHNEYSGCSPDLFVADDGMAEIKCPADKAYFDLLINGKIDTKYIWQMQMQMMICNKKWCDFVAYNPNYDKENIIIRVYPDEQKYIKLKNGIEVGIEMMKKIENKLNGEN